MKKEKIIVNCSVSASYGWGDSRLRGNDLRLIVNCSLFIVH